ncbi:hypothetical protein [Caballeronia cordobensis]|uniref:hypothetical protein n=1 Tax=Caballeronia cordobensis TaxID=1353886 RepID=UPI00190E7511|nr:hypothetical protein [Caballeronia cordobensis]
MIANALRRVRHDDRILDHQLVERVELGMIGLVVQRAYAIVEQRDHDRHLDEAVRHRIASFQLEQHAGQMLHCWRHVREYGELIGEMRAVVREGIKQLTLLRGEA